jgi:uncharacterized protein (TIGR04141 family)
MTRKPPLQKLTMYLLKEGLRRDDVLRERDVATPHRVASIDAEEDSLFVASNPPHAPAWRKYIVDHVVDGLQDLVSASCSAVLLFQASDRLFAVTFGQGRHLIEPESFEFDFGLKVVLNTVAPDQLKSRSPSTRSTASRFASSPSTSPTTSTSRATRSNASTVAGPASRPTPSTRCTASSWISCVRAARRCA